MPKERNHDGSGANVSRISMHTSTEVFFDEAYKSVRSFNDFVAKHALIGRAVADHICYKCASPESFERIRALFEFESVFIYQSIISSRRIAYIRFERPLVTELGPIHYLELSDQKPDASQHEGFDHIEVYPISGTYEGMVNTLAKTETVIHVERPHYTTDDVEITGGFIFRCTREPLIEKIKRDEMNVSVHA